MVAVQAKFCLIDEYIKTEENSKFVKKMFLEIRACETCIIKLRKHELRHDINSRGSLIGINKSEYI